MRFLADGPSIPDELLVARDEGRVVFFCGAGVSRARVGLLDFLGLTKAVADKLAISADSPTRKLIRAIEEFPLIPGIGSLVSADRVFSLIEKEFSSADIYEAIASALKPPISADLSSHRTILDLAKGPDGKTRLVTTNFDFLFEECDKTLATWRPPRLPNPLRADEFTGVVHLHGHVTHDYTGASGDGFIISSAEFGRAYLSERWAADFIRTVLQRYVVVFVGYAADDPPMQYLLEALNRTAGSLSGVYAFQSGSKEDAEARWGQKGVRPIVYDPKDNHGSLWKTLDAWAERANNSDAWYERLISRAKEGPEKLEPFRRGQIAHVISTLDGARRLSQAETVLSGKWLCVFDPSVRFAKPSHLYEGLKRAAYFDPFDVFGIDADLVPKKIDPDNAYGKREVPAGAWDCFALTRLDRENLRDDQFSALRGHYSRNVPSMSARLSHVARWITRVAHDPATVWWAARQIGLHPELQQQIKFEFERASPLLFTPVIRRAWQYIFESWETNRKEPYGGWYELAAAIKADGWNASAVRRVAALKRPHITIRSPFGAARPPSDGKALRLSSLVSVDVNYPHVREEITPPDDLLRPLVRELRKDIELGVALERELEGFGLSQLSPIEDEPHDHPQGINRAISEFVKFFRLLTEKSPRLAKQEVAAWAENNDEVFSLLKIWVCGDERLITPTGVGAVLMKLSSEAFWNSRNQRDLLIALSKRWSKLPAAARKRIEQRILKGSARWKRENLAEFKERRAFAVLARVTWLAQQGCKFSFDIGEATRTFKSEIKGWKDSYAARAAESMAPRVSWVGTDTKSDALLHVPLREVLPKAQALSGRKEMFVEHDPYAGLATAKPVRALAAIGAVEKGFDTVWAWTSFLNAQARKDVRPRLVVLIAGKIIKIDKGEFAKLIRSISDWLLRVSEVLLVERHELFDTLWNRLAGAMQDDADTGSSSIVSSEGARDWVTDAINNPVGHLAQALFNDLPNKIEKDSGLPENWKGRAEQLLALHANARRHALAILCHNLTYLYYIDPRWTERALVSVILSNDSEDAAAFWAGFFWGAKPPQESLFKLMKPALLALADQRSALRRQHAETLAGLLLIGWNSQDGTEPSRIISSNELRAIILGADDDFRSQMVWHLETWSKDGAGPWGKSALVFLKQVWPKQLAARSPAVSARLAELAFSHDDDFVEYADAVLPLLVPINRDHLNLTSVRGSAERNPVDKFPAKALELLKAILPDDARLWPYGINDTLRKIGEAAPELMADPRLVELNRRWNSR